ncbi:Aste57867_19718 [Aphanomyces stellatus]|uniref:Aste57867_19718 protein n=1 Tax=Aphanomyces stellatus TaxID=120398 RepID=A0A485LD82_9STRA|nr:hypothetical protein As57867_019653 [Aphanomyces stellatus]VFT96417.1 Aste57867_19718 [Aphanomyces stellatus]
MISFRTSIVGVAILLSGLLWLNLTATLNHIDKQHAASVINAAPKADTLPSSSAADRARAAAIGGFVSDAATMPLHWIYNAEELGHLVAGRNPAFFYPPASKYYDYPLGHLSPYGDEIVSLLDYLAETPGPFSPTDYATASYDAMKAYTGRLNSIMKDFIANVEAGKVYPHLASAHPDPQGLNKVPLLVARYAGASNLVEIVRQAVKVHQHHALAIEAAVAGALILERIVLFGSSATDAIVAATRDVRVDFSIQQLIAGVMDDVETSLDVTAAIAKYGKSCPLPGGFQGIVFILLAQEGELVSSIQKNIVAGGDNCGRSIFIGAVAAAAQGSVPQVWTEMTTRHAELNTLVNQVVAKNPILE